CDPLGQVKRAGYEIRPSVEGKRAKASEILLSEIALSVGFHTRHVGSRESDIDPATQLQSSVEQRLRERRCCRVSHSRLDQSDRLECNLVANVRSFGEEA